MKSETINQIIKAIQQLIPLLVVMATDIWPVIQKLIITITSSEQATPEQLAATRALKQQADDEFDKAVAKRLAQIEGGSE